MRALKAFIALLVLGTWLPCTVRCSLEVVALDKAPACCDDAKVGSSSNQVPVDSNHCVCSWVKSGGYDYQPSAPMPVAPTAMTLWLVSAWQMDQPITEPLLPELIFSPPELPATWQFSFRAALSPRAPSLVS